MRNRDWIQRIALIDLLNCFIQNCDQCVLCMLGIEAYTDRCDKFYDGKKTLNETCYDCVAAWLNEKK